MEEIKLLEWQRHVFESAKDAHYTMSETPRGSGASLLAYWITHNRLMAGNRVLLITPPHEVDDHIELALRVGLTYNPSHRSLACGDGLKRHATVFQMDDPNEFRERLRGFMPELAIIDNANQVDMAILNYAFTDLPRSRFLFLCTGKSGQGSGWLKWFRDGEAGDYMNYYRLAEPPPRNFPNSLHFQPTDPKFYGEY